MKKKRDPKIEKNKVINLLFLSLREIEVNYWTEFAFATLHLQLRNLSCR